MRAKQALSIMAALFAVWSAGGGVYGQDTVPETPPELRDFRLDPERATPRTEPLPTIAPSIVTPPPAVPTLPETAPQRSTSRPIPSRQVQPATAAPVNESSPTVAPDTSPLPETVPSPIIRGTDVPLVDEPTAAQSRAEASTDASWWPVAMGLGLCAITLLAFVLWKRRNRKASAEPDLWEPTIEEQHVEAIPEAAVPSAAVVPIVQPAADKPLVTLGFIPEKATISFTALTVKGQLQLTNEGKAPAKNIQLRAGLISASAQQDQVIEAFHQNATNVQAKPLSNVQPGERVGMGIELSVPLADLQSFPLGNQQLLVPIVVANLDYSDGVTPTHRTFLACMIGRESDPSQPKMAPLRLDLGPRSFAPLGQRRIAA